MKTILKSIGITIVTVAVLTGCENPEQAAQVAEIITEDIALEGKSVEDAVLPTGEDRGGAH